MSATIIQLHDKEFGIYLQDSQIKTAIEKVATRINEEYAGKTPLFLAVLNGSFMFAADLLKEITIPCEISFVKLASYQNTQSTGNVKELVGLNEDLSGRNIIILEDIVDTGHTLNVFLEKLQQHATASVEIASLLVKPACLQYPLQLKYAAISIPNDFVVGYGLDSNGLGRNLRHLYKLSS